MSYIAHHDEHYTIRVIDEPVELDPETVDAIQDAVYLAFQRLSIRPHLFITILPSECLTPENETFVAMSVYTEGSQHVQLAGSFPAGHWKESYAKWIEEIKIATIIELVHYKQEVEGRDFNSCEAAGLAELILGMDSVSEV